MSLDDLRREFYLKELGLDESPLSTNDLKRLFLLTKLGMV